MSSENDFAADQRSRAEQAEALLRSLSGVLLARIVADEHGRIREIHVLGDDSAAAGQIARNVQSALLARFGTFVELDSIIVNSSPPALRNGATPLPAGEPDAVEPAPDHRRPDRTADAPPEIDSLELERTHAQRVRCHLSIRWAGLRLDGAAEALDGPAAARAEVAARAAIAALNHADAGPTLELEGIRISDIAGRPYATVAVRACHDRSIHFSAGAAPIEHSAEDAAANAAVQAAGPLLTKTSPEPRRTLAAAS